MRTQIKLFLSLLLQKKLVCVFASFYRRQQHLVLPSLSIKQNAQRRRNICAQIYLYFFRVTFREEKIEKEEDWQDDVKK
jgi:hypothetical protein